MCKSLSTFSLFLVLIITISCNKRGEVEKKIEENLCVLNLIEEKTRDNNCLDIVYKYKYKAEIVYYFSFNCPDFYHDLYNENCQLICHPSGGISGNGDGNCIDFFDEATDEEIIWQK
jgi:hypothetical protein